MLRFVADEDVKRSIINGLRRRQPMLDILDVQAHGLRRTKDPLLLDLAVREGRVLLTHDVNTMTAFAYDRIRAGQPMPGLVVIPQSMSIGRAIDELLTLAECSRPGEWEGQVVFLPL